MIGLSLEAKILIVIYRQPLILKIIVFAFTKGLDLRSLHMTKQPYVLAAELVAVLTNNYVIVRIRFC